MQDAVMNEEAVAENGRFTLTIADALLLVVLVVGAVLRFTDLGEQPLAPLEAEAAWTAWAFWQPESLTLAEGSPLYFSLTRLLTPVLGFSDSTMRLVPALFGFATLLLPWLWRNRLGTIGALVMGLWLAISPLHTHISRFAGSDATAVFATLLLLIALFHYLEEQQRSWLFTAAVALAIGLSSTPLFFSSLLTLLIAFGIYRTIGISLLIDDELDVDDEEADSLESDLPSDEQLKLQISAADRRTAVIVFAGVFVAMTTLFLWNPAGIGTAVRQFSTWLGGFNFADFSAVSSPFLSFFRYQPGLILLGFISMGWATWRNHPLGSFCIYWFAAIVILALLQPGVQGLALLMSLPALILVALFADEQLSQEWDRENILIGIGSFVVYMLIWVNIAVFLRNPNELLSLWIILFALVFAGTLIFFIASLEDSISAKGPLLALIFFFAFYGWGTAWWLGHDGFHDTRERWISSATDDDIRVLVPVINELSRQVSNSNFDLDIYSHVDTPVLHWYLRDYVNLQFADTITATTNNAVIITPSTTELALTNDYLGSDYGLLRSEPELVTSEELLIDTLRWWFFQDTPTPLPEERVILWLRSDLTVVE